jgi:hypothetical protein
LRPFLPHLFKKYFLSGSAFGKNTPFFMAPYT